MPATQAATISVSTEEVWAVRGEPVAVPLAAGKVAAGVQRVGVRRADGVAAEGAVWWIKREAPSGERGVGWLGTVWGWSARSAESMGSSTTEESVSAWVIVPPAITSGATEGSSRWVVGGSSVRVHIVDAAAVEPAGGVEIREAGSALLRRVLRPALASPFAAWRAKLVLGENQLEGRFDDVLGVIERNETRLWFAAIARLRADDEQLARRIARRLTGLVDFGNGVQLPVWVQSGSSLAQLRSELLAPDISREQRMARVRAWLDTQSPGAAWVSDDAGLRDGASGAPMCTVVFTNLSDEPAAASAIVDGASSGATGPAMTFVEPGKAARLRAIAPVGEKGVGGERAVIVRAGGWTKRVPVLCEEVPARPPGLSVGPLVLELSNEVMGGAVERGLSAAPAAIRLPPDRATSGLLMCEPARVRADGRGEAEKEWTLYLECLWPRGESAESDRVHVLLGPIEGGAGAHQVVVDSMGKGAEGDGTQQGGMRILRRADRWVCWVKIPRAAIEVDGRLRIGLVREVVAGNGETMRATWPRPVLPGASVEVADPGRLCVDLTRWSRVTVGGGVEP